MHAIWIEIPVHDLDRATRFYAGVFGHEPAAPVDDGVRAVAVVPGEPTVSFNRTAGFRPSPDGTLPYFAVDGGVADAVARVVAAGGTVVEPVTARGELGLFALVADTEGNRLYLHGAT